MPDDAAGDGLGAQLQSLLMPVDVNPRGRARRESPDETGSTAASKLSAHLHTVLPPSCSVAVPAIGHSDSA